MKGDRPWGHDHNRYDTDSEDETDSNEPDEGETKRKLARKIYISDHFVRQKKRLVMDYDKYRWIHDIRLVKTQDRDRKHYPKCIGGKNACPPYGCGPPEEYNSFLKSLKDPKHKDHINTKFFLNMSGQAKFNPTKFKASAVVFPN
ncbi:uncharacterized protein LOC119069273 isoform X2 [Bradysia coprophila]|nr:uncharacterized protein LOC119069273 isoform X2 [Bradysia coprophila]